MAGQPGGVVATPRYKVTWPVCRGSGSLVGSADRVKCGSCGRAVLVKGGKMLRHRIKVSNRK